MQTEPGNEARSVVASELAAMFLLCSLPQMLTHYEDCMQQEWERLCRDFAKQIGLPRHRYVEVCYPFFVSWDWDQRHKHSRRLLCTPQMSKAELDELKNKWVQEEFGLSLNPHANQVQLPGCIHNNLFGWRTATAKREEPLLEALAKWSSDHGGVDFFQYRIWLAARKDKRLRTVLPEQFHPIPEKTPDENSPAEHAVRTVKSTVKDSMLSSDLHDPAMRKGVTYQKFVRDAVNDRLRGVRGQHHVRGSVRKLPCILKILAAERDEEVVLDHVFGTKPGEPVPEPGPKNRYVVKGTAGGWIRDTRWT